MHVKKITMMIIVGSVLFMIKGVTATEALHDEASFVVLKESEGKTTFEWVMNGGEVVLAARMDMGNEIPRPLEGLVFPADAAKNKLKLTVEISIPGTDPRKDCWRAFWGVCDDRGRFTLGYHRTSDPSEERIPVRLLPMPINVEGLKVYVIPFRIVGDGVDSLVIAIASDKETIQKHVKLDDSGSFDWEASFHIAAVFLTDQKEEGEGD